MVVDHMTSTRRHFPSFHSALFVLEMIEKWFPLHDLGTRSFLPVKELSYKATTTSLNS
jgi:hypothetical protein